MNKTVLATLGILLMFALAPLNLGCAGAGDAEAASEESESPTAQQAKDTKGSGKDGEEDEEEKKEEAVPVEVIELKLGAIESVLNFSANLEAEKQVMVMSQAKRLVTELLVEEGDPVERGTALLRLEDEEQLSAMAKVKRQLEKAEREYERQERLYQQQLISEEALPVLYTAPPSPAVLFVKRQFTTSASELL